MSYKERLKEQHVFSWDERREKWDRRRFFGILKLLNSDQLSQEAPAGQEARAIPKYFPVT